jgi:hypothetical protein
MDKADDVDSGNDAIEYNDRKAKSQVISWSLYGQIFIIGSFLNFAIKNRHSP